MTGKHKADPSLTVASCTGSCWIDSSSWPVLLTHWTVKPVAGVRFLGTVGLATCSVPITGPRAPVQSTNKGVNWCKDVGRCFV